MLGQMESCAPSWRKSKVSFTGALKAGSLTGPRKAEALSNYARLHQISLDVSHAYADSLDDVSHA